MLDFLFDDIIMDFHNYYSYSDMKFLDRASQVMCPVAGILTYN